MILILSDVDEMPDEKRYSDDIGYYQQSVAADDIGYYQQSVAADDIGYYQQSVAGQTDSRTVAIKVRITIAHTI